MKHPWDRRLGFWWLAEEYPDQPAVVSCPSGVTLTFSELAGAGRTALSTDCVLRALAPATSSAYALPNDVDMLCSAAGGERGRLQLIALNPALSGAEIQRIVDHSEAAAMILHHDFAHRVEPDVGHRVDQPPGLGRWRRNGFISEESLVEGLPTTEPPDRQLDSRSPIRRAPRDNPKPLSGRGCQRSTPRWPPTCSRALVMRSSSSPSTGVTWSRPVCTTAAARVSTWGH